jgi:hypothetical protein
VATRADIEVNVKGLKKVQELSKLLDKVSGKVNQLNKGGGAASEKKNNKLEKESLNLQEKKRASMVRVRSIGDQIAKAKAQGLNVDKASRSLNRAALANSKGKFKLAKASADSALLELKSLQGSTRQLQQQKILRAAQSGGFGSGGGRGGGGGGFGAAISSAAISGAFPLLFGQGPAAAAGGFGGGLVGSALGGPMGGFAGGLIGTTVVTAFQEQVVGLANALDPLNADIDTAIEKLGILSTSRKAEIKFIEQLNGKQAALSAITSDVAKVVGIDGVQAFSDLRRATGFFVGSFSEFSLKIKAEAAKLLLFLGDVTGTKPSSVDLATKDLQSIGNKEIDELTKNISDLDKTISNLKDDPENVNRFLDTFSKIFEEPGSKKLISGLSKEGEISKAGLQENKESKENRILQLKAQNAGIILDKKSGVELENKFKILQKTKLEQERINELRAKGISGPISQEIISIEKIAKEKDAQMLAELKGLVIKESQTAEGTKANNLLNEEILNIEKKIILNKKNLKDKIDEVSEQMKLTQAASETVEAFQTLNTTIQNDIKQGIKGLIKGTSTLGDLLNNVADRFLDIALNQAMFGNAGGKTVTGGLFKMLGFANGGRPPVGRPSIVGEKGPELFVPRSSGTIVPNNKLGGGGTNNVVVNVDASGSDVQGDDAGGQELGSLIAVAVQGELVKQQRPGGLLNR